MMKTTLTILSFLLASTVGCSANDRGNENENIGENETVMANSDATILKTTPVPSNFFRAASQQGKVERLEYISKDYTKFILLQT